MSNCAKKKAGASLRARLPLSRVFVLVILVVLALEKGSPARPKLILPRCSLPSIENQTGWPMDALAGMVRIAGGGLSMGASDTSKAGKGGMQASADARPFPPNLKRRLFYGQNRTDV